MKIKCVENIDTYLSIGKTYDVIKDDKDGTYLIIDDRGDDDYWYYKSHFKPLSEIRNDKIDKLLDDES